MTMTMTTSGYLAVARQVQHGDLPVRLLWWTASDNRIWPARSGLSCSGSSGRRYSHDGCGDQLEYVTATFALALSFTP